MQVYTYKSTSIEKITDKMTTEIYTIRTTSGREDIVIDLLSSKIKAEVLEIKTVFHPFEIKGYVFVEGSLGAIQKVVQGLMHIKGIIEKPVKLEEIQHFLEYKTTRLKLNTDDVVEIIGGPFKGERGKITRIDKVKGEVTIELLEAAIPIPVTVSSEFVKIVKRAKPEEVEPEKEPKKPTEAETETKETGEIKPEEKSVFDDIKEKEPEEETKEEIKEEEKKPEPEDKKDEEIKEEKEPEKPEEIEETKPKEKKEEEKQETKEAEKEEPKVE